MRKSRLICSKQKTKLPIEHFILLQEQRPGQLLVNLPLFFLPASEATSTHYSVHIRSHCFGTMSPSSLVLYHLFGAIIFFFLFSESHAAHQLNELFAIMKCLHADISRKSSGALSGPLISTYVWGRSVKTFRLHHSGSSEKIKNSGSLIWLQIEPIALL